MDEATALLANLRSRGIELATDGSRLRFRPSFMVTAPELDALRAHKGEVIALLCGPDRCELCPACRWPLDAKRRCPKCFDRVCIECGNRTGSYFVMTCVPCGHASESRSAEQA